MAYRENSPAFQEYASDMLANRDFRSMSLAERGLLNTMRLECWVGRSVPANPDLLAKVLGFQTEEVRRVLTPAVLVFFNQIEGDLISPDLEAYREEQHARKARIIEGGRAGGKKSQSKKRDQAPLEATLEAGVKAPERRGEERRREEGRGVIKGEQLSEEVKEWIKDFDEAPSVTEGRPSRR
jgi:hypothetical protein